MPSTTINVFLSQKCCRVLADLEFIPYRASEKYNVTMAGNTIGQALRVTTYGESHGPAIGVVIDGCPPQLEFDEAALLVDMQRRRPGSSKSVTQRKEDDRPEIISGVYEGHTTGTPINMLIRNTDTKPKDYDAIKDLFRPGHADYTYWKKYGIRDHRGSGRASARETAARVAAGAIAKMILKQSCGASVRSCLVQVGELKFDDRDWDAAASNPYFCPEPNALVQLENYVAQLRKEGDSCGAVILIEGHGVPVGLGEPVFDRLDADLAKALMSINAVKAVEIGDGMAVAGQRGTEHGDEMTGLGEFASNHAGGILGGISTGQPIVARMALKPTSSITTPRRSVDKQGQPVKVVTTGRHDPCVGLRAPPIAEAMMALVLADHLLRHRGQVGTI